MKYDNQENKKQIIFWIGILNLLISLIYIPTMLNISIFCIIIAIICFNNSKQEFKAFFINPVIRKIIKARKKKKILEKEIILLNKQKKEIELYTESKKQYILDIRKYNEILSTLAKKEKETNKNIIILKDREQELKNKIENQQYIKEEIAKEEKELELLKIEVNLMKKVKENLKKENKINEEKMNFKNNVNLEYINNLNGIEFEKFISILLKYLEFDESYTTKESGDYGIDVIGTKNNIKYAIQCKNYLNPVGNKAIQEAYSGKDYYDCHVAIVVTNNHFTTNAIRQASKNKVVLWDRETLLKIIKSIK